MVIEIKGIPYNIVVEFFEDMGLGEGDLDIYIEDYGLVDAEAGDTRPLVEISFNSLSDDEEDAVVDAAEELVDNEDDAEVDFL